MGIRMQWEHKGSQKSWWLWPYLGYETSCSSALKHENSNVFG